MGTKQKEGRLRGCVWNKCFYQHPGQLLLASVSTSAETGQSEREDLMVPTLETSNMQLTQITIKSSSKCFTIVRKNDLQPRILHSGILSIKYESTVSTFSHTWSQFYLHTQTFSRSYWKMWPGHSGNTYFYKICTESREVWAQTAIYRSLPSSLWSVTET